MKYLVVTTIGDVDDETFREVQQAAENLIPGVKIVVISGATSATLVDAPDPAAQPQP